jgi:hypothetical protein
VYATAAQLIDKFRVEHDFFQGRRFHFFIYHVLAKPNCFLIFVRVRVAYRYTFNKQLIQNAKLARVRRLNFPFLHHLIL